MFKAAMKAMDLDVFGLFIAGYSDVQRTRQKQAIGDILPWEEEYESGANKAISIKDTYLQRMYPKKIP